MSDENTLRTDSVEALAELYDAICSARVMQPDMTLQDFGNNPVFKRAVAADYDALAAQPRDDGLLREARDCIESAVWSWEREKDLLARIATALAPTTQPVHLGLAQKAYEQLMETDSKPAQEAASVLYGLAIGRSKQPDTQGTDSGLAEEADRVAEYADQSYVEGVRDLADMIERDKTANWLAVANVLRDCAAIMERDARTDRKAVLEEAAKVAEGRFLHGILGDWDKGYNNAVSNIARDLRALAEGAGK